MNTSSYERILEWMIEQDRWLTDYDFRMKFGYSGFAGATRAIQRYYGDRAEIERKTDYDTRFKRNTTWYRATSLGEGAIQDTRRPSVIALWNGIVHGHE